MLLIKISPLILSLTALNATEISKNILSFNSVIDSKVSSEIIVDLNSTSINIDKNFYGSHLDSYSQIPNSELVKELQLGRIRVGGNEFDVNNWKLNKSLNSKGEVINLKSNEEYVNILKSFNTNGVFQINLSGYQPELIGKEYVTKRSFSEKSAYEMVKYLNGTKKLNITDFSLGNEFSIWNETHNKIWPSEDGISGREYIERYIKYAVAVRTAQDEINGNPNSIKLWGPEISTSWYEWNTSNFSQDCEWTDIKGQVACHYDNGKFAHFIPYFLAEIKKAETKNLLNPKGYKLLDYLSIHYYPNFRTKASDPNSVVTDEAGNQRVLEILESTRVFNDPTYSNKFDKSSYRNFTPNILGRMNKWLSDYYPNAKLAMNEFAVDSDYQSNSYNPIIRPLYLADTIGILTKEKVAFFNNFLLSSEKNSNLPWSLIEGGVRKNLFYMYKLFTNNFKGEILNVQDNLLDVVNSYASVNNGIVNLAIINKGLKEKSIQVFLKDKEIQKVFTVVIAPWSANIVKFDKNNIGKNLKIEQLTFGAKEMNISMPK